MVTISKQFIAKQSIEYKVESVSNLQESKIMLGD